VLLFDIVQLGRAGLGAAPESRLQSWVMGVFAPVIFLYMVGHGCLLRYFAPPCPFGVINVAPSGGRLRIKQENTLYTYCINTKVSLHLQLIHHHPHVNPNPNPNQIDVNLSTTRPRQDLAAAAVVDSKKSHRNNSKQKSS